MQEMPGLHRRRLCGAAAATVAASPRGVSGLFLSERSNAMNALAQRTGTDKTAIRPCWTERAYPKLVHYNKLDKGGHFPAWEQMQLFVQELRSKFETSRS
jgi:hypothetical protein